jgi:hypothetical protein
MISVLIPTRHRLDKLPRAVEAIRARASAPVEILVGVDDDDTETVAWARQRQDVIAVVKARPDTLGAVTNALAAAARGNLLLGLADDMEVVTPQWDVEVERVAARVSPNGEPFAFYLNDTTAPGFPSVWGVNRSWVDICGFACAPWFPYWWGDTWIMEVGMASGRLFPVPVMTGQIAGRGKTTGLRDVLWWSDFFARTRPLRMRMADAISAATHPPEVQERLKAVQPQVAEHLASMQTQHHTPERAAALEAALGSGAAPSERYTRAKAAAARFLDEMPFEKSVQRGL